MKKINLIIILAVAIAFACYCSSAFASDEDKSKDDTQSGRNSLTPAKLFNFERFKSLFNKRYNSLPEELARTKIFFANAFRAFLSLVGYKHYKKSSYLKVNEMSDWTIDELRAIEIKRTDSNNVNGDVGQQPAANLEDIELKLKEIVDEKNKEKPGYAEILDELESMKNKRQKRDTRGDLKRSSLSVENLLEKNEADADDVIRSNKLVNSVPSNNPAYVVPELDSYGAEDDNDQNEPLSEEKQSTILSKAAIGINSVGGFFASSINSLLGIDENVIHNDNKRPSDGKPDEVFVDHRQTNCLVPIKSQKACGSCYIFSSTALYEYQYCKETGKLVSFSEQYPLSCSNGKLTCAGGQETPVSLFYHIYGIELEKNYPYRHRAESCPYDTDRDIKKMGYLRVNEQMFKSIWHFQFEQHIKRMPIILGIAVSDNFHHYGGGVDMGEDCNPLRGHSVVVIGAGREDGVEYWLIRNSYGLNWGEKGHYKLAKRAQNCFLDNGMGWVLDPFEGTKVFGNVNQFYDGSTMQNYVENTKPSLNNMFKNVYNTFLAPKDPNMVTPPPSF